jgi:PAS domain S-box-containing protein
MVPAVPPADPEVYRLIVEAAGECAIYLLDPEGRISSWNPGAERIKGYRAQEVMGRSFSLFFTEEDRQQNLPGHALETARREGRFKSEGWRLRKDGSRFRALAVLDAVRDAGGRLVGFAKITRDITDQYHAQKALLDSERRFRLLVQGVIDYAIFMLEPDGTVANWNAGARRIKGYRDDEIVGTHFSRFYTEEDRARDLPWRALSEARRSGRFEAEGWRLRKDGSRFWATVVIDAIHDDNGELVGFAKITRDLTERRRVMQALEETRAKLAQSQKLEALGQLTSGVAHDFNNILQVVNSGLALAEKLQPGDARLPQLLQEMRRAADKAAKLTSQLLAFSGQAPLKPERVDTRDALQESVNLLRPSMPLGIAIELECADGVWPMRVDTAHFSAALLNLALNARDAMPAGGILRIIAANVVLGGDSDLLEGEFVAIRVEDTGVGIPAEVIERIFEPFFTTKPSGKGTGLGMSLVHGFAEQAGGTVTVESEVDVGTRMTLYLPRATPEGVGVDCSAGTNVTRLIRDGLRVLVVDDEPRLTMGMLEGAGHQAISAEDARAALALLEKEPGFDLLLSDVVMPSGMDGVGLAREARDRWPDLPVLLATGFASGRLTLGTEFPLLDKPFTAIELTQAIAMALRHKKAAIKSSGTPPATFQQSTRASSPAPEA